MANYKILIVDDEPNFLKTIVSCLEKAGELYEIFMAVNAKTAYDIAVKMLPDLIITDWEMPNMSGLEFIQKLKDTPETKQIPVIMCTGLMTSSENLMTALETGAVDYIRKPIDEVELIARIRSMLVLVESFKENQKQKEQLLLQKNELLENKIDLKNKELTTNTLNSVHYRELLISIARDLENILDLTEDESIDKYIRSIINKLNISRSNSTWEEFKKYFEKVHRNFFSDLITACTNLTQNEIKICALIKLNFSSKDISAITGQSNRSVDVARYRLRKKLGLPKEESLFAFLAKF